MKEKKNEALHSLVFTDNKTLALHAANLYQQYKANMSVNHGSQHSAQTMSQFVPLVP